MKAAAWSLPRLQDAVFVAIFLAVLGLGPRLLNMDGDLGRHLTIGKYILESRSIPTRDIFSFTLNGQPLTPHEWLAEVIFAAAYQLGGLDGVVYLCALLLAITFTLLYRQAVANSCRPLLALVLTGLAAAATSLHWLARPHLFTLLLTILWLGVLERMRLRGARHGWLLPVLMLAWANLHGAFLTGFLLWGLYFAAQVWETWREKRSLWNAEMIAWIASGISAFLASLVNPVGLRLWATSLGFLGNRYLVGHTAEYLPPDFTRPGAWPFLVILAIAGLVFLARLWAEWRKPGRLSAEGIDSHPSPSPFPQTSHRHPMSFLQAGMLLLVFGGMALASARQIPLFALVATPVVMGLVDGFLRVPGRQIEIRLAQVDAQLHGYLWPVIALALVAFLLNRGYRLDFASQGNRFDPGVFPVEAVDWLEAHPPSGYVFNHFPWGGYLLYRMWPEQRVFIDGQTDFYGETLTRAYEQVITLSPGWQEVLQRYQVSWALLPSGTPLARALASEPGWRVAYQDDTAVVLVR